MLFIKEKKPKLNTQSDSINSRLISTKLTPALTLGAPRQKRIFWAF